MQQPWWSHRLALAAGKDCQDEADGSRKQQRLPPTKAHVGSRVAALQLRLQQRLQAWEQRLRPVASPVDASPLRPLSVGTLAAPGLRPLLPLPLPLLPSPRLRRPAAQVADFLLEASSHCHGGPDGLQVMRIALASRLGQL